MTNWIKRLFLILILFFIFSLLFLSFYGLETEYFNTPIKNKIKQFNQNINLDFKNTRILIDLKKAEIQVKIQNPIINFDKKKIALNKLDLNVSIKSVLKRDEFALQNAEIGLTKVDVKHLIKFINQIKAYPFLYIVKEMIDEGKIKGEAVVNFNNKGKVKDDYKITGNLINFNAIILKKIDIDKIEAEFEFTKNNYQVYLKKGNVNSINLSNSEFVINKKNQNFNAEGILALKANINDVKKTKYLLNMLSNYDFITKFQTSFDIKTSFSFQLDKNLKIKNLLTKGSGKITSLNINHDMNTNKLKKIFVNYNNSLKAKDTNINFTTKNKLYSFELDGLINLADKYEKFKSKIIFNEKRNTKNFDIELNVKSLNIKLPNLNYEKKIGNFANLKLKGDYKDKESFNLEFVEFKESDNFILIKNVSVNEKIEINNIKELAIKTKHNNSVNNEFRLINNGNIIINGRIFDSRPLLINLYKSKKKNIK